MARRGGRRYLPRVQQDISGTLATIAREMIAQENQNIMQAWKNGGEYYGKKVTDDMVLAHWRERMEGLSKDDPNYDQYKNEVLQLQYGIEQSKADLAHVQGKLSDSQYANFFLNWAKKVPKGSEFWRTLQKDAASLMQQAKERARVDGERARRESYGRFTDGLMKGSIGVSNALQQALQSLSQQTGLDMEANGDRLLSLLTEDFKASPSKYRALSDALKTGAPGFGGTFTHGFVAAQLTKAADAYGQIATRARKEGYASDYATAASSQSNTTIFGQGMKVWSVAQSYDAAFRVAQETLSNPTATQEDKVRALETFASTVEGLSKTPGIDVGSKAMLEADVKRARGEDAGDSPSFGSAVLGHAGITPEVQVGVAAAKSLQEQQAANPDAFRYTPTDKNGNYDPSGQGPIGIVPAQSVDPDSVTVAIPGLDGRMKMVQVPTHDILVDSDPLSPGKRLTASGKTATYYIGGKAVSIYSYSDNNGKTQWTKTFPGAPGTTGGKDDKGNLVITPPPLSAQGILEQAQAIDRQYGTHIADMLTEENLRSGSVTSTGIVNEPVKVAGRAQTRKSSDNTVTWENGRFKITAKTYGYDAAGKQIERGTSTNLVSGFDSAAVVRATFDQTLLTGDHLNVTFDTPLATSVSVAQDAQSTKQVAAMALDPSFQQAFLQEAGRTYGTTNPLDPRIVAAWNEITERSNDRNLVRMPNGRVIDRTDLQLPGVERGQDPSKTNVGISFGGQNLKLPQLPGYMQNQLQGAADQVQQTGLPAFLQQAALGNTMLTPGGVIKSTTVSPTSGASVVTNVTPTPAPTPVAAPGMAAVAGALAGLAAAPTPAPITSAPAAHPIANPNTPGAGK